MPRNLSDAATVSSQSISTPIIWLILLEITSSIETFYLVNNTESIFSNGNEYIAYPFNVVFGSDDGERLPAAQLVIDNVTGSLVETIRTLIEPPDITIRVVLHDNPDIEEIIISDLKLRGVTYDAYTIKGTLYADDILNQRFPAEDITKGSGYIGLFR